MSQRGLGHLSHLSCLCCVGEEGRQLSRAGTGPGYDVPATALKVSRCVSPPELLLNLRNIAFVSSTPSPGLSGVLKHNSTG